MLARHVSHQLSAYIDGKLPTAKAQRIALHLAQCPRCRAEHDQIHFGMTVLDELPFAQAPAAIWTSIEADLSHHPPQPSESFRPRRLAFAAVAIMVVTLVAFWALAHRSQTGWQVVNIRGTPAVNAKLVRGVAQIGPGQWIETDRASSATVKVGQIGSVEIAPNTRVRVLRTRPRENRLALVRGKIRASVSAPPRLFFVETPSGTAVDLGCEYSLSTNEDGSSLLRVTRGWVSFQWRGLESLVPAGASCQTKPHLGPGIPYFDDAPENLKQALASFVTDKSGTASLDTIMDAARVRDTLSLWHLLSRTDFSNRKRIYDRMASLTPVPAGLSRDKVLKLDPDALAQWKDELAWTW